MRQCPLSSVILLASLYVKQHSIEARSIRSAVQLINNYYYLQMSLGEYLNLLVFQLKDNLFYVVLRVSAHVQWRIEINAMHLQVRCIHGL